MFVSREFADVVLKKAQASFPERQANEPTRRNAVADMDSDSIPF
jgi:hypothetical protein